MSIIQRIGMLGETLKECGGLPPHSRGNHKFHQRQKTHFWSCRFPNPGLSLKSPQLPNSTVEVFHVIALSYLSPCLCLFPYQTYEPFGRQNNHLCNNRLGYSFFNFRRQFKSHIIYVAKFWHMNSYMVKKINLSTQ